MTSRLTETELPILLTGESDIPYYLQIRYQLAYLINSNQLQGGAQLPSIQGLARSLGVNPATVARAYQELEKDELIHPIRGKGTFVCDDVHTDEDYEVKQHLLNGALDKAIRRGLSLGFTRTDIQHWMNALLSSHEHVQETVFVGYNDVIAEKYAREMERRLGPQVRVHPTTIDRLDNPDREIGQVLEGTYYVVTLTRLVHRVEAALAQYPSLALRVVGIATEVVDDRIDALARISSDSRACLIVQERFFHSALNLLQMYSSIGASIPYAFDTDRDKAKAIADEADIVIHTYGVRPVLDELAIPDAKRLELTLEIHSDSIDKLSRLFQIHQE